MIEKLIAGAKISRGQLVSIRPDGKVYPARITDLKLKDTYLSTWRKFKNYFRKLLGLKHTGVRIPPRQFIDIGFNIDSSELTRGIEALRKNINEAEFAVKSFTFNSPNIQNSPYERFKKDVSIHKKLKRLKRGK